MAKSAIAIQGTLSGQGEASQPTASERVVSTRRPSWWLIAIPILAVGLAVLAYAEAVWLHDLPHDSASRIALVAFPEAQVPVAADDWTVRLVKDATAAELIRSLIGRLDLRDSSTGQPLAVETVAESMRLGSQCIELNSGQPNAVRGLLLYNVVRGPDAAATDKIAAEWSKLLVQRSATEFPGLTVRPVDSLGVPYEICR